MRRVSTPDRSPEERYFSLSRSQRLRRSGLDLVSGSTRPASVHGRVGQAGEARDERARVDATACAPLQIREGADVVIDPKLCLYYGNRLVGYGLEELA